MTWVEGGYEWGMPMNTTWEKVDAEEPVGAASVELSIPSELKKICQVNK